MKHFYEIVFVCCFIFIVQKTEEVIHSGGRNYITNLDSDLSIHKVTFTQKGYIQFLKYVKEVPLLTDFTFCIWIRSHNLTYSHPILSYSKHEEERFIRFWISPGGNYLNLEILEIPVFQYPVKIVENHWYHICQSWSSYQAAWNLYLNGKLRSSGFQPKLRGIKIDSGGDIVVGQEYTDFDKGLDDGIEGDVFGFNFVSAPTTHSSKGDIALRRHFTNNKDSGIHRPQIYHRYVKPTFATDEIPTVLSYFNVETNRKSKGIMDFFDILLDSPSRVRVKIPADKVSLTSRIINDFDEFQVKPLGLRLVELSFKCFLGRGAPITGRDVVISWTKTPVRVFGGAILKSVPPFCV